MGCIDHQNMGGLLYAQTPQLAHTTFQGILKGVLWRVKLCIQGNLQHVSTEFLENHQIRTHVKLHIQGNFQGI